MMRLDYVLNKVILQGSIVNMTGRIYLIIQRERRIFTVTSHNFCISTPLLTLEKQSS